MAEALSACPSGANGGNLGQMTADQVTSRFAEALAAAEPGCIHPAPVATPYGWHVLYLERRIEGRTVPFEAVEEKIKSSSRRGSGSTPSGNMSAYSSAASRSPASHSTGTPRNYR